jgi:tetratricopeptide (TPR) repeat protein
MLRAGLLLAAQLAAIPPDPAASDPLRLSEEMLVFLDEHVDRNLPQLARLERLVDVVFKENLLHFTYDRHTKTAARTFSERSGNCLSYTSMLIALAREIGLDASFREVEMSPTWDMEGDLVFLSRHVNAAFKIQGVLYVVDLAPEVNRIEIAGRIVPDKRGLAHFFNNLAAEALAGAEVEKSLELCRRAIALDPKAGFAWGNLGVIYARMGDSHRAEDAYLRALRLDKQDLVAMSNLARLYQKVGLEERAEEYSDKVEKFRQKNPYYHFMLGERAYRAGRYEESLQHYRRAIKKKPKEHHFYFAAAKAYAQVGDSDRVRESLEKALEFAPDAKGRRRYAEKLERLVSFPSYNQ